MLSENSLQDSFELVCHQPFWTLLYTRLYAAVTTVGNVKIFLTCATILQASLLSKLKHSLTASGKPVRREWLSPQQSKRGPPYRAGGASFVDRLISSVSIEQFLNGPLFPPFTTMISWPKAHNVNQLSWELLNCIFWSAAYTCVHT